MGLYPSTIWIQPIPPQPYGVATPFTERLRALDLEKRDQVLVDLLFGLLVADEHLDVLLWGRESLSGSEELGC